MKPDYWQEMLGCTPLYKFNSGIYPLRLPDICIRLRKPFMPTLIAGVFSIKQEGPFHQLLKSRIFSAIAYVIEMLIYVLKAGYNYIAMLPTSPHYTLQSSDLDSVHNYIMVCLHMHNLQHVKIPLSSSDLPHRLAIRECYIILHIKRAATKLIPDIIFHSTSQHPLTASSGVSKRGWTRSLLLVSKAI